MNEQELKEYLAIPRSFKKKYFTTAIIKGDK